MDWDTWQNFGKKIANVQTPDAKLNLFACQDFEFGLTVTSTVSVTHVTSNVVSVETQTEVVTPAVTNTKPKVGVHVRIPNLDFSRIP